MIDQFLKETTSEKAIFNFIKCNGILKSFHKNTVNVNPNNHANNLCADEFLRRQIKQRLGLQTTTDSNRYDG